MANDIKKDESKVMIPVPSASFAAKLNPQSNGISVSAKNSLFRNEQSKFF